MAGKHPGRPKGSKNAVDVVVVERSHCPKCGSTRRSEYWGRLVQKCPGLRADDTPYAAIIPPRRGGRRRCQYLDCGQVSIERNTPNATPVMRHVERRLLPSTKAATTWHRFLAVSRFMAWSPALSN